MRALMWILARCNGKADADETPIGYLPKAEDIEIEGLEGITVDTVRELLQVDKNLWLEDAKGCEEFYAKFGSRLPKEMAAQLAAQKERLSK
jgi:phosphoenolpyruvate carboxykinase (GTP)